MRSEREDSCTDETSGAGCPWTWARVGHLRWQVNSEFLSESLLARLDRPERLLAPPAVPLSKDYKVNYVVRVTLPGMPALVVKRHRRKKLRRAVKDCFRLSPARRSFQRACHLIGMGIPTALPVAAGDVRFGPWLRESYYICLDLGGEARSLWEVRKADPKRTDKPTVRAVGELMGKLHAAELVHLDPSPSNLWVRSTSNGRVEVILVDLDAIHSGKRFGQQRAAKDLAVLLSRVPMNSPEQLSFWVAYKKARRRSYPVRTLIHQVLLNTPESFRQNSKPQ